MCLSDMPHKQDGQHGAYKGDDEHHCKDNALDGDDAPHDADGGGRGTGV